MSQSINILGVDFQSPESHSPSPMEVAVAIQNSYYHFTQKEQNSMKVSDYPPKEDPKPIVHHTSYLDAVNNIDKEHQLKDFRVVINNFLKTTLGSKYGVGTFYAYADHTHRLLWISESGELEITYLQDAKVYILQFGGVVISGDRLSDLIAHALNEFANTELWKQLNEYYSEYHRPSMVSDGKFSRTPTREKDIISWKSADGAVVAEHDLNLSQELFTVIFYSSCAGQGANFREAITEAGRVVMSHFPEQKEEKPQPPTVTPTQGGADCYTTELYKQLASYFYPAEVPRGKYSFIQSQDEYEPDWFEWMSETGQIEVRLYLCSDPEPFAVTLTENDVSKTRYQGNGSTIEEAFIASAKSLLYGQHKDGSPSNERIKQVIQSLK